METCNVNINTQMIINISNKMLTRHKHTLNGMLHVTVKNNKTLI